MRNKFLFAFILVLLSTFAQAAPTFEGRITATTSQGGQATALLYTISTNALRLEVTGSDRPNPVDVLDLVTGELTLLFPHNRSYVHLPKAAESAAAPATGRMSPLASLPPGIGPQAQMPNMPGAPGMGGMSAMPAMPMMPMPGAAMELKATGEKTNLLGFACEKFEIKQRGEIMEIWATKGLLPFQNYVRNQSPKFGPRMIEERWGGLVRDEKMFPLRASLRFENGPERFRFEVLAVTPQKLKPEDAALFLPPEGYFEIQPLPF